ncbi:hypothetical protein N9A48_02610 [Gammaproteobacteria bacterium]|nr:hypothetical protein [Gammaproteobacteria bacterium]
MRKFLIGVPMYLSWAYALFGYIVLMLIFIGILLEILFNSITGLAVLENLIYLYDELLTRQGLIGWIIAIWIPGQYFLSYAIYDFLRKYYY